MRYVRTLRAAFAALVVSAPLAVAGQTRLPVEYKARYQEVIQCLGYGAAEPRIQFHRTVPCPTSGNRRCMAQYPFFQCGNIVCGASGSSAPWDNLVNLPDEYSGSFKHESVHHILWHTGDANWDDHNHPAFRCQ